LSNTGVILYNIDESNGFIQEYSLAGMEILPSRQSGKSGGILI
jgi:hypothetical protein